MPVIADKDRRRQKRVKVQLPMRLDFNNTQGLASTKNISLLGACLNINKEVNPGTRVALSLNIPRYVEDDRMIGEIRGEGAVVRCHPETEQGQGKELSNYELGVFFSNFLPPGEDKLIHYLDYVAEQEEQEVRKWVQQYRDRIKKRKKEIARKRRLIEKKRKARLEKRLKKQLAKEAKAKSRKTEK